MFVASAHDSSFNLLFNVHEMLGNWQQNMLVRNEGIALVSTSNAVAY